MTLSNAFEGKRVLITGHTGFKGGWLSLWLAQLGAEVHGVSLEPSTDPSFYKATKLNEVVDSRRGDIRHVGDYERAAEGIDAELVIHMAAQALVRKSYQDPVDTYLTNVVGTSVVLDHARKMPSLKAAIVVTSDKCYENNEWVWGYRETDAMGGSDPYSASKGCTELLVASYRRSFFSTPSGPLLATVRAGNVFGGGDWSQDRLIPDIVKSTIAGQPLTIRNPSSVRPWQHVLEPLSGYLALAQCLLAGQGEYASGWNFGPDNDGIIDVGTLARKFKSAWGNPGPNLVIGDAVHGPHEAGILRLDSTKARTSLNWKARLRLDSAIDWTVEWYKAHAKESSGMRDLTCQQIKTYMKDTGSNRLTAGE
jgi:CDP-glucose 4,6-dehydratase